MKVDELDLSWEEDTEGRRGPRSHRRHLGGSSGRGRTTLALVVLLAIVAALALGVGYGFHKVRDLIAAPDYNSGGSGEVLFEVKKSQTAADIGAELRRQDIVKSEKAFVQAAKDNPRSKDIQPGVYRLRKQMRANDALSALLDRRSKVARGVTIPEGKSAKAVFALLSPSTGVPVAQFEEAAKDTAALGIPDWWFNRTDNKQPARTVEGFLFPDTYEFPPGLSAAQILKQMVARFLSVATELDFVNRIQRERNISPYEALTVASLAQAEAGIADDLGKVARVAYNRVYKANMPLQFDVTANYWLELQGKEPKHSGRLTPDELDDPRNPYNTVSARGLPAGPINNPGAAALRGALDPPAGDWLYFVAIDTTGRSAFAATLAEHERNRRTACANGVPLCG